MAVVMFIKVERVQNSLKLMYSAVREQAGAKFYEVAKKLVRRQYKSLHTVTESFAVSCAVGRQQVIPCGGQESLSSSRKLKVLLQI